MTFCQNHWDALRQAIKARGLFDLVSSSGKEVVQKMTRELEGEQSLQNFDPLMAAHMQIVANAVQAGGFYLMGQDAAGKDYCPVCEAEKHGHTGWIDKAADGVAEHAKTLKQSADK